MMQVTVHNNYITIRYNRLNVKAGFIACFSNGGKMKLYKKIFWVIIIIFIGCLPVISLFYIYKKKLDQNNGFQRNFPKSTLSLNSVIDLKYPGYYFVGSTEAKIFLGHKEAPAHILEFNIPRNKISKYIFKIPLDSLNPLNWKAITVKAEKKAVYFAYGAKGFLYISPIPQTSPPKKFLLTETPFDRLQILDSTFIIRKYSQELHQNILVKVDQKGQSGKYVLSKQVNGVFGTDGILLKNHKKDLAYIYYYRNRFDILTSNLRQATVGKTIDTNNHVKLKLKYVHDSTQITFSKPPIRVNKNAYLSDSILFISSSIKADNENFADFSKYSVIDCYEIPSTIYIGSFYIPTYDGDKPSDFAIKKNFIFAIYNSSLVIYSM